MRRHGGQMVAITVDPPAITRVMREREGYSFRVLSDVDRSVVRSYGLLHPHGGPGRSDISIPAQFLIGKDGKVLWRHVAESVLDRPDADYVLEIVKRLPGAGAGSG